MNGIASKNRHISTLTQNDTRFKIQFPKSMHIMLTQHKIEAGIKAFGQTENKEVL